MTPCTAALTAVSVVLALGGALYALNRWLSRRAEEAERNHDLDLGEPAEADSDYWADFHKPEEGRDAYHQGQ